VLLVDDALNVGHDEPDVLPKPNAREPTVSGVLEHRLARDAKEAADVLSVAKPGTLEVESRGRCRDGRTA
jgi:hypothetical protein